MFCLDLKLAVSPEQKRKCHSFAYLIHLLKLTWNFNQSNQIHAKECKLTNIFTTNNTLRMTITFKKNLKNDSSFKNTELISTGLRNLIFICDLTGYELQSKNVELRTLNFFHSIKFHDSFHFYRQLRMLKVCLLRV